MPIFVLFGFFRKWGGGEGEGGEDKLYTNRMFLVNLSNAQRLSNNYLKNFSYFHQSKDKPNSRYISKTFKKILCFCGTILWLFELFSGDKGDYADVWMINIIQLQQIKLIWMFASFKSR